MIIRGTPPDLENYFRVNDVESNILHKAGFYPAYIDEHYLYYKSTPLLMKKYQRALNKRRRMINGNSQI